MRVAAAATISPREFSRWAPLTFRNYERRRILLKFRVLPPIFFPGQFPDIIYIIGYIGVPSVHNTDLRGDKQQQKTTWNLGGGGDTSPRPPASAVYALYSPF